MMQEQNDNPVDEFELGKFDEEYVAAEIEKREPPRDGRYQTVVEKVELTRSRTTGNPMLKWTLRILNGEFAGRCLWRHNMLMSGENMKYLKTDLHTCGVEIEKLSDLPSNLERLLDVKLEVVKRTKDDSSNVYLNRQLEIGDIDGGDAAAAADARGQI